MNVRIRAHLLSLDKLFAIAGEFVDIHVQILNKPVEFGSGFVVKYTYRLNYSLLTEVN